MKEYCDMFRSPDLFKKINGESIYQYTMLRISGENDICFLGLVHQ